MSFSEALDLLQDSEKGSKLTLTILRKGEDKPLKFTLTPELTKIDSVSSKVLSNGYGYIRISEFLPETPVLVRNAIGNLEKTFNGKLNGLVIDLRNNPGGLLQSSVDVTNTFLDSTKIKLYNKTIVTAKGQLNKIEFEAKANSNDVLKGVPLIILINEGSASASEIMAGALQDYHRAIVVGVQSFGKGSVQSVVPIDKTHALKLTTGLYFTPAGRQIQNQGIIPDVSVENLKITGDQANDLVLGPVHENELKNHLKGMDNSHVASINNLDLAEKDFQLYEAMKILEEMSTVDKLPTSLAQN